MAEANAVVRQLADEDKQCRDAQLKTFMAKSREIDQAWLSSTDWPGMVSTMNRLHGRMAWARVALEKGQSLYCWYGPAVPEYTVISGRGPYPQDRVRE